MASERVAFELADGDGNLLHALWSRTGKRLIVSIVPRGRWDEAWQIQLDDEQVEQLRGFLAEPSD